MTEEPLKEVPDLFKHFHPFKGIVPVAHQLNFQDAADRARTFLKGWEVESIREAAVIALKLHNEGERLLFEDLLKDGLPRYCKPTSTIYRAKEEHTGPITLNGSSLRDSELFAALSLQAISEACNAISDLERNRRNNTADIILENMQTACDSYLDDLVVIAQVAITHAEFLQEEEKRRERSRKGGSKGANKRNRDIKIYQWLFIQAYKDGQYEGLSKSKAADKFIRENPPESDQVKNLENKERTLLDALRKYGKGDFKPPKATN